MSATMRSLADLLPADALIPADTAGASGPDGGGRTGRAPESVVRPGSTEEVAALLSWASRERVGVLPEGSGRRAARVRVDRPYVTLATDRLSGIDIYEAADLTLTAGAGTPFEAIEDALGAEGQWAPFDPPLVHLRTLGGLVASGESGPLWMGYGELRNHVLGATVVTGDGRTLRLGGRVVKNVAGYDVLKAVVGSRGTLAVITSACIRAFPRPAVDRLLVARADSVEDLLDTAARVGTAPVMPVSSVLVDRLDSAPENRRGDATLLVRLHGALATVQADQRTIEAHVGRSFEVMDRGGGGAATVGGAAGVPSAGADGLLSAARDRGWSHPVVIQASVRPSRLRDLLEAVRRLPPTALVVDAYAGRVRVGLASAEPAAVESARAAVERLGGALRVVRDDEGGTAGSGSAPSEDEARLTERLRETFDPGGVLWPARE